jgi:membrane protease YdiL (CAAX protease family)
MAFMENSPGGPEASAMADSSACLSTRPEPAVPEAPASPPPLPIQLPSAGLKRRTALLVSLVFYLVSLGITIPLAIYLTFQKLPIDNTTLVLVSQFTGWPAALAAGLWIGRSSWKESYALRRCPVRLFPGLLLGCFGLTFVLNRLATTVPIPEHFENLFRSLASQDSLWVSLLALVVLAPLCEELFFRGWMLRGLLKRYSPAQSIGFTAILFALFHLNPWQAIVALPLGLLFGWLAWRTGSLLPGIVGHFIVNFTGSRLLVPVGDLLGYSKQHLEDALHLPWAMVGLGGALALSGLLWMAASLRIRSDSPTLPAA